MPNIQDIFRGLFQRSKQSQPAQLKGRLPDAGGFKQNSNPPRSVWDKGHPLNVIHTQAMEKTIQGSNFGTSKGQAPAPAAKIEVDDLPKFNVKSI